MSNHFIPPRQAYPRHVSTFDPLLELEYIEISLFIRPCFLEQLNDLFIALLLRQHHGCMAFIVLAFTSASLASKAYTWSVSPLFAASINELALARRPTQRINTIATTKHILTVCLIFLPLSPFRY